MAYYHPTILISDSLPELPTYTCMESYNPGPNYKHVNPNASTIVASAVTGFGYIGTLSIMEQSLPNLLSCSLRVGHSLVLTSTNRQLMTRS